MSPRRDRGRVRLLVLRSVQIVAVLSVLAAIAGYAAAAVGWE